MNEGQQGSYAFYEKAGRGQCLSETVQGKLSKMFVENLSKLNSFPVIHLKVTSLKTASIFSFFHLIIGPLKIGVFRQNNYAKTTSEMV